MGASKWNQCITSKVVSSFINQNGTDKKTSYSQIDSEGKRNWFLLDNGRIFLTFTTVFINFTN